jgi:integrase
MGSHPQGSPDLDRPGKQAARQGAEGGLDHLLAHTTADVVPISRAAGRRRKHRSYQRGPHLWRHPEYGVYYIVDHRHPPHGRKSLETKDAVEADRALRAHLAGIDGGRAASQEVPPLENIFARVLEWARDSKSRNKDWNDLRNRLLRIVAFLDEKGRNVDQIDVLLVEEYLTRLRSQGRRGATLNRHVDAWMVLLRRCVTMKLIPALPISRSDLLSPENNRHQRAALPSLDVFDAVLAAVPDGFRAGFSLLMDTGIRFEELITLQPDDIFKDGEKQIISIATKKLSDGTTWSPKSYQERAIPVDQETIDAARGWVAWKASIEDGTRWSRWSGACRRCGQTEAAHDARGFCPACYRRLKRQAHHGALTPEEAALWKGIRPRLGLSWRTLDTILLEACRTAKAPRLTSRDFRRLRVTTLHQQGWAIESIRKYMGHSSCRTTERYLCEIGPARVPTRRQPQSSSPDRQQSASALPPAPEGDPK